MGGCSRPVRPYLASAQASDVAVDFFPVAEDADFGLSDVLAINERAAAIAGVAADAAYLAMESMILRDVSAEDPNPDQTDFPKFIGSLDGRYITQDRVALISGRLRDPAALDEVLVNQIMAEGRDLQVGSDLPIDIYDPSTFYSDERSSPIGGIDATVVGVGIFPEEVLRDEYDRLPRVMLTPAATRRWMGVTGYVWQGLRLDDPSDVDRVVAEYRMIAGDGVVLITRETADQVETVQRSARPVIAALAAFGIAALAAALALGCLTLAPLGGVRPVEPNPGVDVDLLVVTSGFFLVVGALGAAAVIASVRLRPMGPAQSSPSASAIVGRLTAAMPPAAGIGVRRGLAQRRRPERRCAERSSSARSRWPLSWPLSPSVQACVASWTNRRGTDGRPTWC